MIDDLQFLRGEATKLQKALRNESGKNYKTTATVQVMKDLLRKDLENAKVLKSLITGF